MEQLERKIARLDIELSEDVYRFAKERAEDAGDISCYIENLIRDDRNIRNDNRDLSQSMTIQNLETIISDGMGTLIDMIAPLISRMIVEDMALTLASNDRSEIDVRISLPGYYHIEESILHRCDGVKEFLGECAKMPIGGGLCRPPHVLRIKGRNSEGPFNSVIFPVHIAPVLYDHIRDAVENEGYEDESDYIVNLMDRYTNAR